MSAVAHKQTDSVPPYTFEDFIMSLRGVGFPSIEVLCKKLMAEHPGFFPVEWKLNALGLQLVFTGDHADGIHVLTFATRMYPGSSNAFDSLGEAYLFIGDKKNAALNFARALELDPLNSNSARQLDALTTRK